MNKTSTVWRLVPYPDGEMRASLLNPDLCREGSCSMCGGRIFIIETPVGFLMSDCLLCGQSAEAMVSRKEDQE